MTRTALAFADDDGNGAVRSGLLQRLARALGDRARTQAVREDIARQILAQQIPCPEHPMPLPRPSCWQCGRNGAFHRAARIALGQPPRGTVRA